MSRLQVGGFALVINATLDKLIGKVVQITSHDGPSVSPHDGNTYDYWGTKMHDCEKIYYNAAKNLMPLGDKQTQDEFKKELDSCHEN